MQEDHDLRRNALIRALPQSEFDQLAAVVEFDESEIRQQVYAPDQLIETVYFPLGSVFSIVAMADHDSSVEVGTIGYEGFVGLPAFLGARRSPHAAFCQVAGPSARMSVERLGHVLASDGHLRLALQAFTQVTMVQLGQNVACNRTHRAEQRACRWLLTTQDRVGSDEFFLTQEFLAQMLGVRRATVSEVAAPLQAAGFIRYRRGQITILDRPSLLANACHCYETIRAANEWLLRSTGAAGNG